jgi:hypothetical protein
MFGLTPEQNTAKHRDIKPSAMASSQMAKVSGAVAASKKMAPPPRN